MYSMVTYYVFESLLASNWKLNILWLQPSKGVHPFILCWDFVAVRRKGRITLIPLPKRISIKERRVGWLSWNTYKMDENGNISHLCWKCPSDEGGLQFSWSSTLTHIIVSNVVWATASTNQKASNCIRVNKRHELGTMSIFTLSHTFHCLSDEIQPWLFKLTTIWLQPTYPTTPLT